MSALEGWFSFRFNDDSAVCIAFVYKREERVVILGKLISFSLLWKSWYFWFCSHFAPSPRKGRMESGCRQPGNVCIFTQQVNWFVLSSSAQPGTFLPPPPPSTQWKIILSKSWLLHGWCEHHDLAALTSPRTRRTIRLFLIKLGGRLENYQGSRWELRTSRNQAAGMNPWSLSQDPWICKDCWVFVFWSFLNFLLCVQPSDSSTFLLGIFLFNTFLSQSFVWRTSHYLEIFQAKKQAKISRLGGHWPDSQWSHLLDSNGPYCIVVTTRPIVGLSHFISWPDIAHYYNLTRLGLLTRTITAQDNVAMHIKTFSY